MSDPAAPVALNSLGGPSVVDSVPFLTCLAHRQIPRDTLRQRSYSVLIFSSLSRLAVMDSRTELVPLIHDPPSRRRSSDNAL